MEADPLALAHFLLPGKMIVVDGPTANARFLKSNFQRRWQYEHDEVGDVHIFELCKPPLGKYDRVQVSASSASAPDGFDSLTTARSLFLSAS